MRCRVEATLLTSELNNSETAFQCPSVVSAISMDPELQQRTQSTDCVGNNSIIKTTHKTTHSTSRGTWSVLPGSLPVFLQRRSLGTRLGVHSAYNYWYVLINLVCWLCVLLSVSMVCNHTLTSVRVVLATKDGLQIAKVLGNWPPLQNNGWIRLSSKCARMTKQLLFNYMYMPCWKNMGTTLPCIQFFTVGHR